MTNGLTVRDVARRYRVSPDKVRGWIKQGELPAVNTAATMCGKPRWVITPEELARFEGNGRKWLIFTLDTPVGGTLHPGTESIETR
jgi:transposase